MTATAVDALQADRDALLAVCADLRDEDWAAASGCEGWTVKDVVGHVGALFWLVVDPSKLPDGSDLPTEKAQELYVDRRRSCCDRAVPGQDFRPGAGYRAVGRAVLARPRTEPG